MGKKTKERLKRKFNWYLLKNHEIVKFLGELPLSCFVKVDWDRIVILIANFFRFQASMVALRCMEKNPDAKAIERSIATYFDLIERVRVLSYGSTVGAGQTLSFKIHSSVNQVINCSFELMREAISYYVSDRKGQDIFVSRLVNEVRAASTVLEKIPSTNTTAIGQAFLRLAVSVKDSCCHMNKFKPASSSSTDSEPHTHDNYPGDNLSPVEMNFVQLVIGLTSETRILITEILHSITGSDNEDDDETFVVTIETLLNFCEDIVVHIDKLGTYLYPPQNYCAMKEAAEIIFNYIDDIQAETESIGGTTPFFIRVCNNLKDAYTVLEAELIMIT